MEEIHIHLKTISSTNMNHKAKISELVKQRCHKILNLVVSKIMKSTHVLKLLNITLHLFINKIPTVMVAIAVLLGISENSSENLITKRPKKQKYRKNRKHSF